MKDLNHADWVLNSQKALIIKVNANISTVLLNDKTNKKLVVANVSEKDIDNLYFLTNTDQNNNYLYIERFDVYIQGQPIPIPIPGLEDSVKNVYYNSDTNSFLNGQKIHYPFNGLLYQQDSVFSGNTFSEYVDFISNCIPLSPSTNGLKKTYSFVLNPDETKINPGQLSVVGTGSSDSNNQLGS